MRNEKYIWAFVLLAGLYVGLYFSVPIDPATLARYNLSELRVRLLGLTVVVPLMVVFGFALYGFLRMREYAGSVAKSREGPAFAKLADGLMILAFSLPIGSIINVLLDYAALQNQDLQPTITIIKNYTALILPFITFILFARGAEELVRTLKKNQTIHHYNGLFIIVLSCVFTWLITQRPTVNGNDATYYLPDWLIISTITVPYLYMWTRGIMAAFHLNLYRASVQGNVYKQALHSLAQGITGLIILSIALQLVTTISARLDDLSLQPVLLILYVLVALYAVGYGYVARGAKKLKKIEEV